MSFERTGLYAYACPKCNSRFSDPELLGRLFVCPQCQVTLINLFPKMTPFPDDQYMKSPYECYWSRRALEAEAELAKLKGGAK